MNTRQLTVTASGNARAVLTLPLHPTPESLAGLERSLSETIGALRRDLRGDAADDGEIEYRSWSKYLRHSRT